MIPNLPLWYWSIELFLDINMLLLLYYWVSRRALLRASGVWRALLYYEQRISLSFESLVSFSNNYSIFLLSWIVILDLESLDSFGGLEPPKAVGVLSISDLEISPSSYWKQFSVISWPWRISAVFFSHYIYFNWFLRKILSSLSYYDILRKFISFLLSLFLAFYCAFLLFS